ncbi:MAG TPA: KUP/HAK/KT family potassium transporter [Steroidobacteraceae bacterium]|nr:KUP/HAK/KT family potassium transporter [Steroidobacteraceae bacterium]
MNSESIALQKASPVSAAAHRPAQWAGLAALGVVFGDLGTSPLYTLQTIVQSMGGHFTPGEALGILSLVIWTLLITISIKYCLFVMRADNHGEGGILALMSLIRANSLKGHARAYAVMGLLGAALLYGDGVITPAISVLSALEGVNAASDQFKPFVMPAAVVILIALFAGQRLGTERIGRAFGPIMLLWFGVIALLGVVAIFAHPEVMIALDPRHALKFVLHKGNHGLLVLGGVFLCITGGEALYADMGHFGRRPIRGAWYTIVLPALLLSYAGQTAYVMEKGSVTGNPFFLIAPAWSIYPLVALATVATIIASQAIITGSFSMTRQAMQLGWLPGVSIRQTSDRVYGQIYVPVVNWLLMVATVAVTVGFGSSDRLAGAYGTAVSTTMLLTTALLYRAMRRQWRWRASVALGVAGMFLLVDVSFFGANLLKIAEGGWLPLTFAALLFMVMVTWRTGRDAMHAAQSQSHQAAERFMEELRNGAIARIDGTAVFLTRSRQRIARLIIDHAHFTHVLPKQTVALSIVFEDTPRIEGPNCVIVDEVGEGIWHFLARFGFFEIPNLRQALENTCCAELGIDLEQARFIASRDLVVSKPSGSVFSAWRMALFAFLWRNSVKIVDRFNLEPDRTVEIARQVEI